MEPKVMSVRMDAETAELLELLYDYRGGTRVSIIKQAIRELARKDGILEEAPKKYEKELQEA
jgi:predicted transcriptional regulator